MAEYTVDIISLTGLDLGYVDDMPVDRMYWYTPPTDPAFEVDYPRFEVLDDQLDIPPLEVDYVQIVTKDLGLYLIPNAYTPPGLEDPLGDFDSLSEKVIQFLGYRPTSQELVDFPFDIYKFIISGLRKRDQDKNSGGTELMKRFLMGPQEVWLSLYDKASVLNNTFNPDEVESLYLSGLRKLVGLGDDLIDVVAACNDVELRRLIGGAIEFWKERFLDLGYDVAIRIATGNRFKARDYFDFRYIVGENLITEDLENEDSNMISVQTAETFASGDDGICMYGPNPFWFLAPSRSPRVEDIGSFIAIINDTGVPSNNGFYRIVAVDVPSDLFIVEKPFKAMRWPMDWFIAFENDERLTEVRVVDELAGEGALNRTLLTKMLGLQRPAGERINVVYVTFLDMFEVEHDLGMWEEFLGSSYTATVADRLLELSSGSTNGLMTNRPLASTWKNYEWISKVAFHTAGSIRLCFNIINDNNYFYVTLDYTTFGTGRLRLYENASGVPTLLETVLLPSLNLDTFWTYTVESLVNEDTGEVNIKVLVDRDEVINLVMVSSSLGGNVGYVPEDGTFWVAETELWRYPLTIERIGPNP